MATEPTEKRAIAFVDGQNLFHAAKEAFGHTHPSYDITKLSDSVCVANGWSLQRVQFYTGVPATADNPKWNEFWARKMAVMGRQGVVVYSRPLRYRNKTIILPDGSKHVYLAGAEKGIDVRIALDIISLGHSRAYDVALVFSQDQDLSEVADEIRVISREQDRWIRIASAYPDSPTCRNHRGINSTDWIKIDRKQYNACLDTRNYFS